MRLRAIMCVVGGLLIAVALAGLNGAIYYSSVPHYAQQGWAEFCGLNAVWIFTAGVLLIFSSDSHEVSMRQLDWDQKHKVASE